jgi:GTP cyclohydrolase I
VAARRAAADLLRALGADTNAPALVDTPRRIAEAYAELLTPIPFEPTTFPNTDGYDELVVAGSTPFHSLCEHPSKLARVVELFARDLQLQERLTQQIADWLDEHVAPRGVGVVLEAEHLCMSLRGVQKQGSRTVTSALHGLVREDPRTRQEFLDLATRRIG